MGIHLATMNGFFPTTGTEEEWEAASERVAAYLRALHVVNEEEQKAMATQFLQAAALRHATDPSHSPTALVLDEADVALEQWFKRILPGEERPLLAGCIALAGVDRKHTWSREFLADEASREFQQALREYDLRAGPRLQLSSMVPRPIDVPPLVEDVLRDSDEYTGDSTLVIAVMTVAIVILLLAFMNEY